MIDNPPITFTNRANTGTEGLVEVFPLTTTAGAHTLAVEVHQAGTTTSDVIFGVSIRMISTATPALSISSAAGNTSVSWTADSSWELQNSADVAAGYATQAGARSPLTFVTPTGSTNHFYRLQYSGRP
jgi:hypothetical protein